MLPGEGTGGSRPSRTDDGRPSLSCRPPPLPYALCLSTWLATRVTYPSPGLWVYDWRASRPECRFLRSWTRGCAISGGVEAVRYGVSYSGLVISFRRGSPPLSHLYSFYALYHFLLSLCRRNRAEFRLHVLVFLFFFLFISELPALTRGPPSVQLTSALFSLCVWLPRYIRPWSRGAVPDAGCVHLGRLCILPGCKPHELMPVPTPVLCG